MELRAYLVVLRRHIALIVACLIAVVSLIGFLTQQMTPSYQSKTRVLVSSSQPNPSDAYAGNLLSKQQVDAYVVLVESGLLGQKVKTDLGLDMTLTELADAVEASVVNDTVVLEIVAHDPDPAMAKKLAQSYAENLVETAREIETPVGGTTSPVKVTITDEAALPVDPVSPKPVLNIVLAVIFGLILGGGLALLRDLLDTTIRTADDLGSASTPVMGSMAMESLGSNRRLITEMDAAAPRVEAFRVLRTNIQFVHVDTPNKVFVVTSAAQNEGKTSTATNLALSLAGAGIKTLLIDGDLRRPTVARMLGLEESVGVTTVLLGKIDVDEAIQHHAVAGLDVLSSGIAPPNPSELIQSRAMGALLAKVRTNYEVVIIDSPPLLPVTDAALLSTQADAALLVVRYGKTTKDQWRRALERLHQVSATPVGVVLNMVPPTKGSLGYSYQPYTPPRGPRRREARSGSRR